MTPIEQLHGDIERWQQQELDRANVALHPTYCIGQFNKDREHHLTKQAED